MSQDLSDAMGNTRSPSYGRDTSGRAICPHCRKRPAQPLEYEAEHESVSICYECECELRQANKVPALAPEKLTDLLHTRIRKYGIKPADFWALVEKQDGGCAICDTKPANPLLLVVDHNHDTGKVRGLLCGGCNTGLGIFGDSPERLERALGYLEDRGYYGKGIDE